MAKTKHTYEAQFLCGETIVDTKKSRTAKDALYNALNFCTSEVCDFAQAVRVCPDGTSQTLAWINDKGQQKIAVPKDDPDYEVTASELEAI